MNGIGGLGGVLAKLESSILEFLDKASFSGRYQRQIGDLTDRYRASKAFSGMLCGSVDMTCGAKICFPSNETDFSLPGGFPIVWSRFYSSNLSARGLLGIGWRTSWEVTLQRVDDQLVYTDEFGRVLTMPLPKRGSQLIVTSEQLQFAYLTDGRMVVADLTPHYRVFENFNDQGIARLKYIEDVHQQRIGCIWDDVGRLLRIRGLCGHELKMHYAGDGAQLTGIECVSGGSSGFLIQYGYDANGQLAEVRNRIGDLVRRFAYRDDGLMFEETSPLGQVTSYTWRVIDGVKRVVERKTCDGAHEHCVYQREKKTSQVTNVFGHTAYWQYDSMDRIHAYVDFDGRSYVFEYSGAGGPARIILPGNRKVSILYDMLGRVTNETDPSGQEYVTIYSFSTNKPSSVQGGEGRAWIWVRDDRLRVSQEQSPARGVINIEYDENGREQYTNEQGHVTVVERNNWGQIIRKKDAAENVTEYQYDAAGNLAAKIDADGKTTRIESDLLGRPLTVTYADSRYERHAWNTQGQRVMSVGTDGQTRHWHRDKRGKILQMVDEEENIITHSYDAHGRRVRTASGNGAIQVLTWDPVGRLQSIVEADGVTRIFEYAPSGKIGQISTTAGAETKHETFEHDVMGRLIERTTLHNHYVYSYTSHGALEETKREPTPAGIALGIEENTIRFEYDMLGSPEAEYGANGVLNYGYEEDGDQITLMRLPKGQILQNVLDNVSGVQQINFVTSEEESHGITAFRRDARGREQLRSQEVLYTCTDYTERGWPNLSRAIRFTQKSEEEWIEGEAEIWREVYYSPAGNLVQVNDHFDEQSHYDYDRRGCLLRSVADELGIEYFTWDASGNLLDTPRTGWQPVIYSDHRLLEGRGYRYEYDVWGQVVSKQNEADKIALQWDAEGHLISVRGRDHTVRYQYDVLGRRIRKTVEQNHTDPLRMKLQPPETTWFVWNGEYLAQEWTEKEVRTYIYQPGSDGFSGYIPLACVDQDQLEDEKLSPIRVLYYHADAVGTALQLTDKDGHLVWAGRYKAWGRLATQMKTKSLETTDVRQPLRFAGQYADDEIGFYYNGTRFYDPEAGRYLSPDRNAPAGVSPYRYVSNPLTGCNPSGRAIGLARPCLNRPTSLTSGQLFDHGVFFTGAIEQFDDVIGWNEVALGHKM